MKGFLFSASACLSLSLYGRLRVRRPDVESADGGKKTQHTFRVVLLLAMQYGCEPRTGKECREQQEEKKKSFRRELISHSLSLSDVFYRKKKILVFILI